MKHLEELKIGVTAALFCLMMLLVYIVFPKDGLVQTTKAPMPEIPTAESGSMEESYGFQIYTEESNYDDSSYYSDYGYTDSSPESTDSSDIYQEDTDYVQPETGSSEAEEPTGSDDSYVEEPAEDTSFDDEVYEDETYQEDSSQEDYSQEDYSQEDYNTWNETEETYQYE